MLGRRISWGGPIDDGSGNPTEWGEEGTTQLQAGDQYFVAVTMHPADTGSDDLFVYLGNKTDGDTNLTEELKYDSLYTSGWVDTDPEPDKTHDFDVLNILGTVKK